MAGAVISRHSYIGVPNQRKLCATNDLPLTRESPDANRLYPRPVRFCSCRRPRSCRGFDGGNITSDVGGPTVPPAGRSASSNRLCPWSDQGQGCGARTARKHCATNGPPELADLRGQTLRSRWVLRQSFTSSRGIQSSHSALCRYSRHTGSRTSSLCGDDRHRRGGSDRSVTVAYQSLARRDRAILESGHLSSSTLQRAPRG
jgi:hypothetical protein